MEDEVEFRALAMLSDHGVLALLEDVRPQLHRTGLVGAVHVAEGGGKHVPANAIEALVHLEHILGRGVEFFGGHVFSAGRAVFLTADHAGFHLEDDFIGGAQLEVFLRDGHVFLQGQNGGIEHVALEQIGQAGLAALGGLGDQRLEETLGSLGLAMVGMQADEDVVFLG